MRAFETACPHGVSSIDDQPGMLRDKAILHIVMIRDDQHGVRRSQPLRRQRLALASGQSAKLTGGQDFRNPGIVEPGLRPRRPELFQNGQSRAFALVGHVLLVGHADQQDVRAVQALAGLPVDGLAQPVDDIIRHGPVDLARKAR